MGEYLSHLIPLSTGSKKIKLFSAGTGNGEDLKTVGNALLETGFSPEEYIGFDINSENIEECRKKFQQRISRFSIGDLDAIKNKYEEIEPQTDVSLLTIYSGVLTNKVTSSHDTACKCLQISLNYSSFVCLGGENKLVFFGNNLKEIGYKILIAENNFFVLRPATFEERADYLTKQIRRCEGFKLPLIRSANILNDVRLLLQHNPTSLENIEQLDLSLSMLEKETVLPEITEIIKYLPKLKSIVINGSEPWSSSLKADLQGYKIIEYNSRIWHSENCRIKYHTDAPLLQQFGLHRLQNGVLIEDTEQALDTWQPR